MTIQEIRQRCQFDYYPEPHERLLRKFSPYMTWVFLKLGFSANGVTYLSIVLGLAVCRRGTRVCLSIGQTQHDYRQ